MEAHELRDLLDDARGSLLLDVRTPEEAALVSIPGAVRIPLDRLHRPENLALLLELQRGDVRRPIVVFCAKGRRSAVAAQILRAFGFRDVVDAGGLETNPLRRIVASLEPVWRRPPVDLRPVAYQFYRDNPIPSTDPGDASYQRLAWSIGLPTGADAYALLQELEGAVIDVPGLGAYQPFRRQSLLEYTRGQIQQATGGAAFEPWEGFE